VVGISHSTVEELFANTKISNPYLLIPNACDGREETGMTQKELLAIRGSRFLNFYNNIQIFILVGASGDKPQHGL